MKRFSLYFLCLMFSFQMTFAQIDSFENPILNIRLSLLLFPTTPLLTLETKTIGNFTIQFESNFTNTHGVNFKYYFNDIMNESYLFAGIALVKNELLRADLDITYLPYAGYGYAYQFGDKKNWTIDSRLGLGFTTNADNNAIYPVIKTGIGRIF